MSVADIKREFKEIPLSLIDEPVLASRSEMDPVLLEELAEDIRRNGILQPLSVAWVDDRYEVIAGHRRWHAARRAGLVKVPCLVYPTKESALQGVKYAENRHREELSAADEAIFFAELLEQECGGDVDRLCGLVGEKRNYVEGRLNLFLGDTKVFEALQAKRITIGVAQQLNRCPDELQRRSYLHSAIVGGATVAVVSGWIQQWQLNQQQIQNLGGTTAAEPPPAPMPGDDPFRCIVCEKSDHVHTIRHLPVHGHCDLAILRKLIAAYHGVDDSANALEPHRRG